MAFVKFMRNKFFHPHTFENQKRTWIAEQKHESDIKRQEDLHKQYLKEQAIYENKNLLRTGKLTQDDKLAFMYEPPMECRKKEEKMELREVRFEWQKNAPRAGDYAKNLDVADCPFGIEVRNTKCIKCGVWGHMNTDKICPLFNRGLNTEDNPPDLGKEDPMSLLNSMEQGGLKMRKGAVNAVMDVHDNKYRMLEDAKLDPEVAFIANLTDKQKRKLMRKLNKTGAGVMGAKAKNKKKKKKKEKKEKKASKEEDDEEAPTADSAPKNKHRAQKVDQSQEEQVNLKQRRDSDRGQQERGRRSDDHKRQHIPEHREDRQRRPEYREERQRQPENREDRQIRPEDREGRQRQPENREERQRQPEHREERQRCAPEKHRERKGGRSRSPSDQRKEERHNSGARRGMATKDERRSPKVQRKRHSRSPRVERKQDSRSPRVEIKRYSRSPRDRKRRDSKSPRRRRISRSSLSKSPEQPKHRSRQNRSPDPSKYRRERKDSSHDRSRDNKRDSRKQDADKAGRSETRKVKPRNSSTSSSSSSDSDAVPAKPSRVKDKRRGSDDSDHGVKSDRNKRGRKPKVVVKRRKRRSTSSSSSD